MKIQGRHVYAVPKRVVWAALMDPSVLARTLPGCDELVPEGENRFRGTLHVKVGPVQGTFDGTVTLEDIVPLERFRIAVHGEGPAGFMDGAGSVHLEEAPADATTPDTAAATGAAGTAVVYDVDASIGGRVASVGQRLLDSTGRAITRQALEGLGRQLDAVAASLPPEPSPPASPADAALSDAGAASSPAAPERASAATAPPPAPPSTAAFAAGVARDVVSDLVPPGQARWIAALAAGFVVAFVLWWMLG